jgi:beta-glucosidase
MKTTNIEEMLDEMTLEEQVSLLTGADFWTTVPIPRLGVPAIKLTDGPNGARGGIFKDGPSTACFPVGIALGATWNPALIEQVGVALGAEAKLKGARVLLAPTVNLQRTVYSGRAISSATPKIRGCRPNWPEPTYAGCSQPAWRRRSSTTSATRANINA